MVEIIGTAKNGRFVSTPAQERLSTSWLQDCEGSFVRKRLTKVGKNKSHQQVKTIFGLALRHVTAELADRGEDTSLVFGQSDPTGIPIDENLLKVFFYSVCPMFNDDGNVITLSDDDCTTAVASQFFEKIQAWAASKWAIYIPDPDTSWRK